MTWIIQNTDIFNWAGWSPGVARFVGRSETWSDPPPPPRRPTTAVMTLQRGVGSSDPAPGHPPQPSAPAPGPQALCCKRPELSPVCERSGCRRRCRCSRNRLSRNAGVYLFIFYAFLFPPTLFLPEPQKRGLIGLSADKKPGASQLHL